MSDPLWLELLVIHGVVQVFVGAVYVVTAVLLLTCRTVEALAIDALAGLDLWRRRVSRGQFLAARRARNRGRAASRVRQGKDLPREPSDVRLGTHVAHRPGIAG